jgi:lipid-binding SYLF domain-containing protein
MRLPTILVALFALVLAVPAVEAAGARTIDRRSDEALRVLTTDKPQLAALLDRAAGYIVFPRIYKAGMGLGGEYGEGVLRAGGRSEAYYNIVSGSVGFQLGVQRRSLILAFMDHEALARFRRSEGWRIGVDASVVVADLGAGGAIDQRTAAQPIIALVFDERGLMYNLNLEGSKITRVNR